MKTTFEIIIKAFIWLVVIFIILAILINYYWWLAWKVNKWENFCINEKYSIWKMIWWDNLIYFCDNTMKGRCLNLINEYVLWEDNDLYLSFDLPPFIWKMKIELNKMLNVDNPKGWGYNIFQNDFDNKYYTKSYDDIKRFLKLDYNTCDIQFYSNNEIEKLNNEEQNIFWNLKK